MRVGSVHVHVFAKHFCEKVLLCDTVYYAFMHTQVSHDLVLRHAQPWHLAIVTYIYMLNSHRYMYVHMYKCMSVYIYTRYYGRLYVHSTQYVEPSKEGEM